MDDSEPAHPSSIRLAIVHYHLRPGGVARVIQETSAALAGLGVSHVVIAGELNVPGGTRLPVARVPGLGYGACSGAEALAAALLQAARAVLGAAPDAWVFHNPTLGKNRDLPAAIRLLAEDGHAILLHVHDLAEDGRPANFANIPEPARLHPTSARLHHAFINRRDRDAFLAAGLSVARAHLLENPVPQHASPHPIPPAQGPPRVFYPVRGIRRKNLGELCLLAALAPGGASFAVSREPENPAEFPAHDFWRSFAASRRLPVAFDVTDRIAPVAGGGADFAAWLAAATHFVTTSIAEGFGQTAAEAAAWRKPVIARRIPHAFTPADARGLYGELLVPHPGGSRMVDFADLAEAEQAIVIDQLLAAPTLRETLPATRWLDARLADREPPPPDPQLDAHRPARVAARLIGILENLIRHRPGPIIDLPQQAIRDHYQQNARPRRLLATAPPSPRRNFPQAVIFDIYGTLLDSAPGGVKPDPAADPAISRILRKHGHTPPASPSSTLAALVAREHAASGEIHPEIDLVALWAECLGVPPDAAAFRLVTEIEDTWHPATPAPGALEMLRRLAAANIPCGLLSNAQSNAWHQLGALAPFFARDLIVLSHQYRRAKPSPALFAEITTRLTRRGISPGHCWFVGNHPGHDIAPARAAGFRTAIIGPAAADAAADLALTSWHAFPPGDCACRPVLRE